MKRAALLICITVWLSGCLTGPDYVAPEVPDPASYSEPSRGGVKTGDPMLDHWWERFDDPLLTELVRTAVEASPTVHEATARLREARAERGISGTELLPKIGSDSSYTRSRQSGALDTSIPSSDRTSDVFSTGFDATWEIDVFGGTRRGIEASQAELEAEEANLRDTLVTLTAEIALVYVEVRTNQRRLELAEKNLRLQRETTERVESRLDAGFGTDVDVEEAKALAERTSAQIPALKELLSRSIRRVEVLCGQLPGTLRDRLLVPAPIPLPPTEIAVDLPAEMLRRRPDIRRAERTVAAQSAKIGVATAELYPKFQLNGTIGLSASNFSALGGGAAMTSSFGPSIRWRLFEFGAIRKEIDIQDVRLEQAIARYEAATLVALEEVENSMNAFYNDQLRLAALRRAEKSRKKALAAAEVLVREGLGRVDRVLTAQRDWVTAQDERALGESEVAADVISLFKALGGGW